MMKSIATSLRVNSTALTNEHEPPCMPWLTDPILMTPNRILSGDAPFTLSDGRFFASYLPLSFGISAP